MNKTSNRHAAVIGDPVAHSLSSLLHNTWLQEAGILGRYDKIHLAKEQLKPGLQKLFADESFAGANITLPHKTTAIALADKVSALAEITGAANLLWRDEEGCICADNTDVQGFWTPLQQIWKLPVSKRSGKTPKRAIVFGAGGAARAAIIALLLKTRCEILLCNRTDLRAQSLLEEINSKDLFHQQQTRFRLLPWANRNQPEFLDETPPDLLVNAGSAGMTGFAPLDINLGFCGSGTLVYDLVYQPSITPLLQAAQQKGLETLGGVDMLIAQARPCFSIFFGHPAPETNLARNQLCKALGNTAATTKVKEC